MRALIKAITALIDSKRENTEAQTVILLQAAQAAVIDDYARGYNEAMSDMGVEFIGAELDDED